MDSVVQFVFAFDMDTCVPESMVFQILLLLPVVSLLRFKSVCKLWRSIIESSEFITQHLHLHHQHKDIIVMDPGWNAFEEALSTTTSPPKAFYAGLISCEDERFEVLDLPPGAAPSNWNSNHHPWMLNLVGSCHGIVCLHREDDGNVFLWNPYTHQSRALPQPPLRWPTRQDSFSFHPSVAVGFGFDDKTKDYKVVRFNLPSDGGSTGFRIDVYSLRNNSWRTVENAVLPPVGVTDLMSSPKAAYQDSIFCWLGVNKIWGSDSYGLSTLLSFDFSSSSEEEGVVLSTTPLPDSINKCISLHLTIVNEDIVCIRMAKEFENEEDGWWFEMWKLNEFEVKESWVQLHVFGPFRILDLMWKLPPNPYFEVVRCVIGFPKNEKLLVLLWDGQVRSCNPFTRQINTPILTSHIFLQATTYQKTLCSIYPRMKFCGRT